MKIKKIYQGELPENKILNTESDSQTDTYSCEYINNLSTKSYIQASLSKNITGLNTFSPTIIAFDTFIKDGDLFESTSTSHIKVKTGATNGRLKINLTACVMGDGSGKVDNTYISFFKNDVQIGALNIGLFSGTSRGQGTLSLILDYEAGDEFYVTCGTSENTATLCGTYNRTVLIVEEL